ncbi:hypothetical protein RVR_7904 [Actinacidiphila reveromycinica]|uniref:Integrase n=1 Tax=Actinacidiphila reveromycinica TaxID=659352 RepID=A0A7U3UXY8_9ACTN|nr:hypothetical protein [Streptomyces sp. SN-593]BBB00770.1 hypothetical protein RVR_7904 [Streptomyces sp. SN-593]
MSGRGRKASQPPGGHRVAPALAPDQLVVTIAYAEGTRRRFDFAELPVPAPMQHSLARLFAARSARWNSHETAQSYWTALNAFARFIAEQPEAVEDLDGLTAAILKRWRMRNIATNGGISLMRHIRPLLKLDDRLAGGPAAEELVRRLPTARSTRRSYAGDEQQRVLLAAQRQFRGALLRVRENAALLAAWQAGDLVEGGRDWRVATALDELARTGYLPTGRAGVVRGKRLLGGTNWENTWGRLYLDRSELTALAVLLTHRFGWNLSVYHRLPAPAAAPSAGAGKAPTYRIQVEKRRKGGGRWFSTENVTDIGPGSPGRLVTEALEATAFARWLAAALVPGTDRLMVARSHYPSRMYSDPGRPARIGPLVVGIADGDTQWWAKTHGLSGALFQRSRRTTVIREGRPLQHAPGTHESIYVLPDEHVQHASRDVFADGAHEALAQAKAVFGGRLAERPQPGHTATATADCGDEASSPWPDGEGGCGADFLMCLGCPNAHVHPGHHARLSLLHRELRSLRSVLPADAWQERWSESGKRLDDLRDKVGAAGWDAASGRADTDDRTLVHLLLKGTI